ncbi:putative DNA mismatch repair protein MutS [Helianthus annuus]|nr:putative DNA mismatch repair protein MutS [Helianthus annuus]KAJ0705833.1 putative DNA mismatch repair protein MutS [Helianthus annuus]
MKRQQSILSFLQKRPPVPENEQPVTGGAPISYTAAVSNEKLTPRTLFASNRSSIHSFAVETSDEIRGTDTPPEKEQRPFFPLKSVAAGEDDGANRSGQSMFSSIKHKFMKPNSAEKLRDRYISLFNLDFVSIKRKFMNPNNVEKTRDRYILLYSVFESLYGTVRSLSDVSTVRNLSDGSNDSVNLTSNKYSCSNGRDKDSSFPVFPKMENVIDVEETVCKGNKGYPFVIESEGDITGPETPGTQPLVSRLKRVQEDSCNLGSSTTATANFSMGNIKRETPGTQPLVPRVKRVQEDSCNLGSTATDTTNFFMGNSKRVKFSHDILAENKKDDVASEMASKFEWLHPSKIKDANGRRPDNPLYDKRTLYIPPDVFKKMSASQKQYWSVKSQYMDVLIFFKVVSFYLRTYFKVF